MTSARVIRHRNASAVAVACLMLLALAACGVATPLCDEAAGLVEAGALGRAAETYARAERAGEGDCASGGLDAVGSRYADAYANVALGREAEENGEIDIATAAYRSALGLDDANVAAIDALARLGQPAPQLRQPDPAPARDVPGEPRIWLIVLVTVAATIASCMLLGFAAWALWWHRGQDDRRTAADQVGRALGDLARATTRMDEASTAFVQARTAAEEGRLAINEQITALTDQGQRLIEAFDRTRDGVSDSVRDLCDNTDQGIAALRTQLDEVADYFGERLSGPQRVVTRFEPSHDGGPRSAETEDAR